MKRKPKDIEDLLLALIDFFEDRNVSEEMQLIAAFGFATHLISTANDPAVMAESAKQIFGKMLDQFCK